MNKAAFFTATILIAVISCMLSSCSTIEMLPAPASSVDISSWPAKLIHYKSTIVKGLADLYKNSGHGAKVHKITGPAPVIHEGKRLWKVDVVYQETWYYFTSREIVWQGFESYFFEGETWVARHRPDIVDRTTELPTQLPPPQR